MSDAAEITRRPDLSDWRALLGRIEAHYRATSYEQAATFVQQVVGAASADRPDVDLRPPDRVAVSLPMGAVELAATIAQLAADAGIEGVPEAATRVEVAVDALDIAAVLPFWRAVLGYVDEAPEDDHGQVVAVVDPLRIGPAFWFQQMAEPRPQRNRIHMDVTVPHDQAEPRVAAAIGAGGRLVSDDHARAFWVLADPEGNEACVCTWQDREPEID